MCRCHICAGERHRFASLLLEKKETQTSWAHDHQPGILWFRLQPFRNSVFHHFKVQKSNIRSHVNSAWWQQQPLDDPLIQRIKALLFPCQPASRLGVWRDNVPLVWHPRLCVRRRLSAHHLPHLCGPLFEDLQLEIWQVTPSSSTVLNSTTNTSDIPRRLSHDPYTTFKCLRSAT